MTKYKVHLTRMVEEVAAIEVEAATVEEAIEQAEEQANADWASIDTEPGDWCEDAEAYCAHDEAGEVVFDWNDPEGRLKVQADCR